MVDTGELETYLNERSAQEDDIVTIVGAGSIEIKEDSTTGKKRKVLNIPVKCGNLDLIYSPAKKALMTLQNAWGGNTENWVNHKFSVKFVLMQIGKDEKNVIKPVPID